MYCQVRSDWRKCVSLWEKLRLGKFYMVGKVVKLAKVDIVDKQPPEKRFVCTFSLVWAGKQVIVQVARRASSIARRHQRGLKKTFICWRWVHWCLRHIVIGLSIDLKLRGDIVIRSRHAPPKGCGEESGGVARRYSGDKIFSPVFFRNRGWETSWIHPNISGKDPNDVGSKGDNWKGTCQTTGSLSHRLPAIS